MSYVGNGEMENISMNDDRPIRGKVARILNSRELVLNIGEINGVKIKMRFDVMDPKGEDIIDPDSREILGSIERPKVRVEITDVKEKLSVASTFKKKKINIGGSGVFGSDLSRALMPTEWVIKYETLKTDEQTWEDLSEAESYVKIGDPVVQVVVNPDDNNE